MTVIIFKSVTGVIIVPIIYFLVLLDHSSFLVSYYKGFSLKPVLYGEGVDYISAHEQT